MPPSGLSCSFFLPVYQHIPLGFITCPHPCWTLASHIPSCLMWILSSVLLTLSLKSSMAPHVCRVQFRPQLGIQHLHGLVSDLNPHCSLAAPTLTLNVGVLIRSGFGLSGPVCPLSKGGQRRDARECACLPLKDQWSQVCPSQRCQGIGEIPTLLLPGSVTLGKQGSVFLSAKWE